MGIPNGGGDYGNPDPEHCHAAKQYPTGTKKAVTKLLIACFLTTTFLIAEAVGGWLANSIAIMSDAAHLLSDLTSFIVSLISIYLSLRPASKRMNYGYQRAEVLGAVVSVLIIWLITGCLVYIAIERITSMNFEVDSDKMLIVAALGVVFNIILGFVLHSSTGHGHSHGGSPISSTESTDSKNINLRAAFIHVLGDFVQSVGVLVSAYVIHYYPQYKIADPICTFLFSAIVLVTTIPILKDLAIVLMEGTPPGFDYNAICAHLSAIPGVKMVHSLHVWALTLDKNALSVHLAVDV
ncbi:Zinc transporter 2 [Armadillidium nasatum]|uniref:Zinc transporter 2 n=1 Tax=Armadillidium nasatum TaxID=96803 RepID=A0A5N5TPJ8_9CRUS|nr:Zinc transporter 2 [Armadillidium nasatum]